MLALLKCFNFKVAYLCIPYFKCIEMGIKIIRGFWRKLRLRNWENISERIWDHVSDAIFLTAFCGGDSKNTSEYWGLGIILPLLFFVFTTCSFLLEFLFYVHLHILCCSFESLVTVIPIPPVFFPLSIVRCLFPWVAKIRNLIFNNVLTIF